MKRVSLMSIVVVTLVALVWLVTQVLSLREANHDLRQDMLQIALGHVELDLDEFAKLRPEGSEEHIRSVVTSLALSLTFVNNMEICFSDMTKREVSMLQNASTVVANSNLGNLSRISLNVDHLDC